MSAHGTHTCPECGRHCRVAVECVRAACTGCGRIFATPPEAGRVGRHADDWPVLCPDGRLAVRLSGWRSPRGTIVRHVYVDDVGREYIDSLDEDGIEPIWADADYSEADGGAQ